MFEMENPPDYSRFHLKGNPFTILSSEGIKNIEEIHVSQSVDSRIAEAIANVEKGASIAIVLVGDLGTGKTQRLRGINHLISDQGGMAIYLKVDSSDIIRTTVDIFNYFLPEGESGFFSKLRKGSKDLYVLNRENYDSSELGESLKENMGLYSLSALLLDEMENIMIASEKELILFFEMLRQFISSMPPGCLFIVACTAEGFSRMQELFPAFVARFHYQLRSEGLSEEEAVELARKRLEKEREPGREALNPVYPFDESAIILAHDMAKGNPRIILRILQIVLSSAACDELVDLIDDRYVGSVIRTPSSVDEYISRVPKDLRDVMSLITKHYDGGPVSYIQLAKDTKSPPTQVYLKLEELVSMGLLEERKGKYEVVERVRILLQEESPEKKG
ncbi:MAG: ATPase [Theionarchaea archaeon]|nr:ATPase [Theionarchaea archaeon]MBU7001355.1 ATPase [Theionarchaea archaeon]MBU7019415.1 ATPase [Theionarchaea archaeon]MBU7034860.1 ATPase [Theionarchaea archaeon]MBU7040412.1 ATPase [Theionarchaea archaeon]